MLGKLIVFEGVEGCGKTTQLLRLQQWLNASGWSERLSQGGAGPKVPIVTTREPGGTALGAQLRQLLLDTAATAHEPLQDQAELLLYAADRAQHVSAFLQPHLQQGSLVLCDRYTDSTVAYQGYGRGLDLALIEQLNQIATSGLTSDLTFWLDIDVAIGLARAQQRQQPLQQGLDRMEISDLAFHQRVQTGFKTLAQQHPTRIIRIDARQDRTTVSTQIQTILEDRLQAWYPQLLPT